MGFEQLAGLKAKLAEQAKKEARAKAPRRPAPAGKPGAPSAKSAKPAKPAAPSAKPTTPVDPVVRNIGKLQKRFPIAFPKNPAPKVPLKIGIFDDLLTHATELGLSEAELREAIRTWCRGVRYWTCLTEGAQRLDLAGQPAGQVTEADATRGRQLRAGRPKQKPAQQKPAQEKSAQEKPAQETAAEPTPAPADTSAQPE